MAQVPVVRTFINVARAAGALRTPDRFLGLLESRALRPAALTGEAESRAEMEWIVEDDGGDVLAELRGGGGQPNSVIINQVQSPFFAR